MHACVGHLQARTLCCPPVDRLIIPGEILHILLQFERKKVCNILHIMSMHLVSSVRDENREPRTVTTQPRVTGQPSNYSECKSIERVQAHN